jgi:signal transduction histidine kinase
MKGLYARLAAAFIGIATGILLIAAVTFIVETHYHFSMYEQQAKGMNLPTPAFDAHFEQALVQSVLWTFLSGTILAIIVSLYVAKRIISPLLAMKHAAERMARGELEARTQTKGKDEIADLGESLNRLAEQLQTQENLRKTMTSDIAHELRTPLTTLKTHMEAIMEGVWDATPKRLESCYEEIERLEHIVGDLEQLTEFESPRFRLHLKDEDVTAIVLKSVESVRASFEQKRVRLSFTANRPVTAKLDRQRVAQIMGNLLSNALKYTPEGGSVTVAVSENEHEAIIKVIDTGIGIEPEALPYVFERFYRSDKSRDRKSGGSGIGLTIVKKLVDAHGGQIRLNSQVGSGTTVELRFGK